MGTSLSSNNDQDVQSNNLVSNTSNSMIATANGIQTMDPLIDTIAAPDEGFTNSSRDPIASNSSGLIDLQRQSNSSYANNSLNTSSTNPNISNGFELNLFGTLIHPFRWLTLPTLLSWLDPLSSIAMIIGCVMPYVPQYITIYKTKNCSGFSTFVCLTLLMANILRIAFWFGHSFEIPLLVQSIIMILAQLLLLEICVRVKQGTNRSLFRSSPRYFWRWTDLISYLEFLFLVTAFIGIAMFFLINCKPFVETVGYLALVMESMLGLPQVVKNYRKKSVEGMSLSMVLMWLGGDLFKTWYFVKNKAPLQFWLCGVLQITIDLIILLQVCLFKQNAPLKINSQVNESPKEMMRINVND